MKLATLVVAEIALIRAGGAVLPGRRPSQDAFRRDAEPELVRLLVAALTASHRGTPATRAVVSDTTARSGPQQRTERGNTAEAANGLDTTEFIRRQGTDGTGKVVKRNTLETDEVAITDEVLTVLALAADPDAPRATMPRRCRRCSWSTPNCCPAGRAGAG